MKLCYDKYLVWLGRQDSNLGSRDQSPLPYRLATPQSARVINRASRAPSPAVLRLIDRDPVWAAHASPTRNERCRPTSIGRPEQRHVEGSMPLQPLLRGRAEPSIYTALQPAGV
jgi:hypothetical protein